MNVIVDTRVRLLDRIPRERGFIDNAPSDVESCIRNALTRQGFRLNNQASTVEIPTFLVT
jgi:hypothetical protein